MSVVLWTADLAAFGLNHARICLARMQRLRQSQLPHPQGNPRRRSPRAQEILPQGAQAHRPQRVAEKVRARRKCETRNPKPNAKFTEEKLKTDWRFGFR